MERYLPTYLLRKQREWTLKEFAQLEFGKVGFENTRLLLQLINTFLDRRKYLVKDLEACGRLVGR